MTKIIFAYLFVFFLSIVTCSGNQIDALKKINSILKQNIEKLKNDKKNETKTAPEIKEVETPQNTDLNNDSQIQPFIDIGLIQLDLNNLDEAQVQFEKALKVKPDNPELYYYLAKVYEKRYQNDLAIEYYKKALEKKPDYEKASQDVIKLLDTLEKQLLNEIKMDPSFPDTYIHLGYVYMQKKNYPEAETILKKALSLNEKSSVCYDYLGILYYKTGDMEKAFQHIEKAFQLDSENPIIYEHYKMLSESMMKDGKISLKNTTPEVTPAKTDMTEINESFMNELNSILVELDFGRADEKVSEYVKQYGSNEFLEKIKAKIEETREKRKTYSDQMDKLLKSARASDPQVFLKQAKSFDLKNVLLPDKKKILLASLRVSAKAGDSGMAEKFLNDIKEAESLLNEAESEEVSFLKRYLDSIAKGAEDKEILDLFSKGKFKDYENAYSESLKKPSGWLKTFTENLNGNLVVIILTVVVLGIIAMAVYLNLPFVVKKKVFMKMSACKNSGDWKKLLELSAKISKYSMNSSEKFLYDNLMIRAFLETGDYEKTAGIARNLLKKDPQNRMVKEYLGKAYLKLGKCDSEIIPVYLDMLKYDSSNLTLIDAISDYYIQSIKDNKEEFLNKMIYDNNLLNIFKRTLRNFPDNMKILKILGKIYLGRRKTESDAIKVYEKILEFEPQNLEIHKLLAQSYFEREIFDKASKESRYILNYEVENMMIHRILQQSMLKQGLLEQLIEMYQSLISRNPEAVQVKLLLKNLEDEVANKFYSKVQEKEEDFDGRFKSGVKYMQEGNIDSAIKMFEISFNMPKLKNRSAVKLIECYINVDLLESAEEYFEKLKIDYSMMGTELKNICYMLGKMNEEKGNYKKALKYYDIICKVDIGYRDVFDRFEEIFTNLKGVEK